MQWPTEKEAKRKIEHRRKKQTSGARVLSDAIGRLVT